MQIQTIVVWNELMCNVNILHTTSTTITMTTEVDKTDEALKGISKQLLTIEAKLETVGKDRDYEMVLRSEKTALLTKEASLKAEKRELQVSAPSGNPINLSQSLHEVFECGVVVSLPLVCRGSSLPHILSIFN